MKRPLPLLICFFAIATLTFTSCNNYGEKITVDGTKGEVFYKEGVTKEQAQKLGDFLKQDGFFNNNKAASVQVAKQEVGYLVSFVYNKTYYEQTPGLEDFFKTYGGRISKEIFEGQKVDVALVDKYFKQFKSIPYDPASVPDSGAAHKVGINKSDYSHQTVGDVNFYWKDISNLESKPIVDYISQSGAFSGGTAEIYISKEEGRFVLKFPVKEEFRNDSATLNQLSVVSKAIKDSVFPNDPYSFLMTDEYLNVAKAFDY